MDAFSGLTTFDVVILSIILISSLMAFLRGFVAAVLSFSNWVASSLLVIYAGPIVAEALSDMVDSEQTAKILASVLIFAVSFLVLAIINSQIVRAVKRVGIGALDRTLGLAFGMVRGVLIGVVIFLTATIGQSMLSASPSESNGPKWLTEAKSYNLLKMASGVVVNYIPDEKFKEAQEKIREIGEDAPAMLGGMAGSSASSSGLLSDGESELMDKAISGLPAYEIQQLAEKYGANLSTMTDLEKRAFYKEIFRLYEDGASMGVVPEDQRLNAQEYNELYRALQRLPVDEGETGYKPRQLDDINRLIDTVE